MEMNRRRFLMRHVATLLSVFLLSAPSFSQDAANGIDVLVRKLGAETYEVREQATTDLIALADAAVPALKKALESKDLEVRLRASRALREIRKNKSGGASGTPQTESGKGADSDKKGKPAEAVGPHARSRARSVEIELRDGKVRVKTRVVTDGKEVAREYEGASIEELKKRYPELRRLLSDVRVTTGSMPKDSFDLDEIWKSGFSTMDRQRIERMQKDARARLERFQALERELTRRFRMPLESRPLNWPETDGPQLGAFVAEPDAVLAAQLELNGRGVVIQRVLPGTLAEKLGFKRYDILMEINGVVVTTKDARTSLRKGLLVVTNDGVTRARVMRRASIRELTTGNPPGNPSGNPTGNPTGK